jgi:hypothetical protein
MNGRVHLRIVFLFGGFVAFDLACQALSPYPDVYDKVYESGSQAPQTITSPTSGDASATEDATEGDGETVGDSETAPTPACPTQAAVFAGADNPQTITLDSNDAYWTNAPVAGSGTGTGSIGYLARSPASNVANSLVPNLTEPLFIANANGYVAWSDLGSVGLVNVKGGASSVTTVSSNSLMTSAGVAFDTTNVYWVTSIGGVITIEAAPAAAAGGIANAANVVTVGTVSTTYTPSGLSVQNGNLYLAAYAGGASANGGGGAIYQIPTTAVQGILTPLQSFNEGTPDDVVSDGTNVYWSDLKVGGGSVLSTPLAGGTITPMASMLGSPHFLAVDSKNIYTADFMGGAVYEIPLGSPVGSGGMPTTLATGVGPAGVAADDNDNFVYFTSVSAICRVAKQ